MSENRNSAEVFCERVEDLIASHLLLAQKSISNLLRYIANTPVFMNTLSESLASVSYVEEFERSRVFYFKDGKAHLKFVLPTDKYRCFTLVVCLLAEIDEGRRNFLQFLQEYFPDADDFASFQRFCGSVLYPFKNAGESILTGDKVFIREDASDFAAKKGRMSDDEVEKLKYELESVCKKINGDTFRSADSKNECISAAVSLGNAIVSRNADAVRRSWIGFKNTAKVNQLNEEDLTKLHQMLTQSGLL